MGNLVVADEAALTRFRRRWLSPKAMLSALDQAPVVVVNVPVGVGKSRMLDDLLDELRIQPRFGVVIVLVELTASLLERRLIRNPPTDVRRLKPRPQEDCGPLDQLWQNFERLGCAAYAKQHVCPTCQHFRSCSWPKQYGRGLKKAKIIFGTHAQLRMNPHFVQHVRMVTRSRSILLILDEAGVLQKSLRVTLVRSDLGRFVVAVQRASVREAVRNSWVYQTNLITRATTKDLRRNDWKFPLLKPEEVVAIQEVGLASDPQFRWPGYDLLAFGRCRPDRRWSDDHGIHFVCPPYLADRTLILSADMDKRYVRRQLGVVDVHNPIPGVRIHHRGTRFYNLCSLLGAARRFEGNHRQILDVFAQLILRNMGNDRLTLLVTRKHLKNVCIEYLSRRLAEWGSTVQLIASRGEAVPQANPGIIPIIHYGISGINSFEEYHAAYCLNSFYLDEDVLREAVADVEDDDLRFPIRIKAQGTPKRRMTGSFDQRLRASDADEICRTYYHQLETNVVIQAVGRVRFATRPREVITFQATNLPGIPLHREFHSLRELREHFGLLTGSEFTRKIQSREAKRFRQEGLTTQEIAERLGVSERTVRYRLAAAKEADA
jgi:AcrR family transcriptional regulator